MSWSGLEIDNADLYDSRIWWLKILDSENHLSLNITALVCLQDRIAALSGRHLIITHMYIQDNKVQINHCFSPTLIQTPPAQITRTKPTLTWFETNLSACFWYPSDACSKAAPRAPYIFVIKQKKIVSYIKRKVY